MSSHQTSTPKETLLNFKVNPSFLLACDPLSPPSSPSPSLLVSLRYLETFSNQDPQWPCLAGTQEGKSHHASHHQLQSFHSQPQLSNTLPNRCSSSHFNAIHWRLQPLVQTQSPSSFFIPVSWDNALPSWNLLAGYPVPLHLKLSMDPTYRCEHDRLSTFLKPLSTFFHSLPLSVLTTPWPAQELPTRQPRATTLS